jgi:hypothetical protein
MQVKIDRKRVGCVKVRGKNRKTVREGMRAFKETGKEKIKRIRFCLIDESVSGFIPVP